MTFIQYIFIASVCLGIFHIAYKLMFRNEVNFNLLRFYLLSSILLSLIIPLSGVSINIGFIQQMFAPKVSTFTIPIQVVGINSTMAPQAPVASTISWWTVTKNIYLVVSAILVVRIFLQFILIVLGYYRSERVKIGRYMLVLGNKKSTYSFFSWIFINRNSLSSDEFEQIVSHEKAHASQYHSIDLILVELLAAVMWFNPFIWMTKGSLQLVHEYLADEGALSTGIDRLRYQALLVNQVAEERLICLSSSFNHSLIKKRMIMMTKSKLNSKSKLRILVLLPVAAVAIIFTAGTNGALAAPANHNTKSITQNLAVTTNSSADDSTKKVKARVITLTGSSNTKSLTINATATSNDSTKIIYVVDGVQVENIETINSDSIKSVNVLKNDNVVIIRSNKTDLKKDSSKSYSTSSNILYIIDGVEQASGNNAINNISPDAIESINVIKGDKVKEYTSKSCDGVIQVTTKKNLAASNVLYIVDGVEQPDAIKNIDQKNIKKVEIVNNEEMKKYTSKSYDAVMLITTKKGKK
ncbi:MAG: TonB-dependent receptor plug domain-containing protein [Bacteroidales bacterium]